VGTPSGSNNCEKNLARLEGILESLTWFTYALTNFNPKLGCPCRFPTEVSIYADLELAHAQGFKELITLLQRIRFWAVGLHDL
jgi:hypothetical protein